MSTWKQHHNYSKRIVPEEARLWQTYLDNTALLGLLHKLLVLQHFAAKDHMREQASIPC